MRISILIPVYNEAETIKEIVRRVESIPGVSEIIIVDDASTDGTEKALAEIEVDGLQIFRHEHNQGKGAAVRTGLSRVSGDIVVIQDADLEYDPRDIPALVSPIVDGEADVVYGSRFLGGPHRVLYFWHYLGNRFLTLLSNMFTNLNLTDMETGYKAFRAEIVREIEIESDRFGFEPEITAKVARLGCRIYELPISYFGRGYEAGKKITWRDGIAAFYHILRFNLRGKRRKTGSTGRRYAT